MRVGHIARIAALTVGLIIGDPSLAGGSSEGMAFTSIGEINSSRLRELSLGKPREVIGGTETPHESRLFASAKSPNVFVRRSGVSINPDVLRLHLRVAKSAATLGPPIFRMRVGGRTVDLAVVDYVFDPSFRLFHLGAVLLSENGTARFTVSAAEEIVVGTFRLEDAVYRLRQNSQQPTQTVFEILMDTERQYSVLDIVDDVADVEARHVQMAMLADMNPEFFNTSERGAVVHVSNARLGQLDWDSIAAAIAPSVTTDSRLADEEVGAFLRRLAPLTRHVGELDVRVTEFGDTAAADDSRAWAHVEFQQLLGGVPIEDSGYLSIDEATGEVKSFNGILFDSSSVGDMDEPRLLERDALARAVDAIYVEVGATGQFVTVYDARLVYVPMPDGSLRLTWHFELSIGAVPYIVHVDGVSGSGSVLRSGPIAAKRATCVGASSQAETCDTPYYVELSSGSSTCYPGSPCDNRHLNAWEKAKEIEEFWSDNSSGYCCAAVGMPNGSYPDQIKILVDSDHNEAGAIAFYDPNTDTIVLPPTGTHGLGSGVDPTSPGTQEVLSHEMMHVYQRHANSTAMADSHSIPSSVREGYADINAVLTNGAMEGDWTVGDGEFSSGSRDFTEDKELSDFSSAYSAYRNGEIWGNFYYRLSQQPGVDLPNDLVKVLMGSYDKLRRSAAGGSTSWELEDVRQAMIEAAGADTPLKDAILAVWNAMSGSGGGGGGGSGNPPASPANISASFIACDPYLYGSIYNESWSASSGADFYMLYYSQYNSSGPWWFVASTPNTSKMTETWVDAYGKVRACNEEGCSILSLSTNWTPHICW